MERKCLLRYRSSRIYDHSSTFQFFWSWWILFLFLMTVEVEEEGLVHLGKSPTPVKVDLAVPVECERALCKSTEGIGFVSPPFPWELSSYDVFLSPSLAIRYRDCSNYKRFWGVFSVHFLISLQLCRFVLASISSEIFTVVWYNRRPDCNRLRSFSAKMAFH